MASVKEELPLNGTKHFNGSVPDAITYFIKKENPFVLTAVLNKAPKNWYINSAKNPHVFTLWSGVPINFQETGTILDDIILNKASASKVPRIVSAAVPVSVKEELPLNGTAYFEGYVANAIKYFEEHPFVLTAIFVDSNKKWFINSEANPSEFISLNDPPRIFDETPFKNAIASIASSKFSRIARAAVPVSVYREEKRLVRPIHERRASLHVDHKTLNLFSDINHSFNLYGLMTYKLSDIETTRAYFNTLLAFAAEVKEDHIASMKISKGNIHLPKGNIHYRRKKSDGTYEKREFIIEKVLGNGSSNQISLCTAKDNGRTYIFRSAIISHKDNEPFNIKNEFNSFYENIKHIILYIYIRKVLGNIKFIPQPYYFGLDYDTNQVIFIMEQAKIDLGSYLILKKSEEPISLDVIKEVNKILFNIYYALYLINTSELINFRHGDFKYNNIMLTEDNLPLILDFGMSCFVLENNDRTKLIFNNTDTVNPTKIYRDRLLNVSHDMMHLLYTINKFFPSFKNKLFMLPQNKFNVLNSYVLDEIIKLIELKFTKNKVELKYINTYGPFYKTYVDLEQLKPSQLITLKFTPEELSKITSEALLKITPKELADNLGITFNPVEIFPAFERKYLKYKIKYLQLKKLLYL
jgi:hypothetical protein